MINVCSRFLPWMFSVIGCATLSLTAAPIANILIPISVSIPTTNLNDHWMLCAVPAASCNASALLTITDAAEPYEIGGFPAGSGVDVIHSVDLGVLESGYITFLGLDTSALDSVVIGLRSGFVNPGDPWPFATPESQLTADILSGNAAAVGRIRSFFNANLAAFPAIDGNGIGSGGVIYRFSNASVVGSIGSITATPEPSVGGLLTVSLGALAIASRALPRRRK